MIKIERFINQLMESNCYLVVDEASHHCVCIDPASEKAEREIAYINGDGLVLDYIFLTHEHTDHTWGVNALLEHFPEVKVVCSTLCRDALRKEASTYFQLYYDNPSYTYTVKRVDFTSEELKWHLTWCNHCIAFIATPGHSPGSICIAVDDMLFGGDTLMPFKPHIKKRLGGSQNEYRKSLLLLKSHYPLDTVVFPGHGGSMALRELLPYYTDITNV